jgi:hypothetical protein
MQTLNQGVWPLRAVDSADISLDVMPNARLEIRIRHAPLPGLTPTMLMWWYARLGEPADEINERGIVLTRTVLGDQIVRLEHKWVWMPRSDATRYFTHVTFSSATPPGQDACPGPVNFTNALAQAWIKHHVEEIGLLEHFLPALYAYALAVGEGSQDDSDHPGGQRWDHSAGPQCDNEGNQVGRLVPADCARPTVGRHDAGRDKRTQHSRGYVL